MTLKDALPAETSSVAIGETSEPAMTPDDSDLLNTRDAAALAGFTDSYFEKLRQRGGGPEFRRIGRRSIRYERRAVKDWKNSFRAMRTVREAAAQK